MCPKPQADELTSPDIRYHLYSQEAIKLSDFTRQIVPRSQRDNMYPRDAQTN